MYNNQRDAWLMQRTQSGSLAAALLCHEIIGSALHWFNSKPEYFGLWSSEENRFCFLEQWLEKVFKQSK